MNMFSEAPYLFEEIKYKKSLLLMYVICIKFYYFIKIISFYLTNYVVEKLTEFSDFL